MTDCANWASLSDKAAAGEPLSPEERLFVRSHPSACRECAAEAQLWEALGGALEDPAMLATRPGGDVAGWQPEWRGWKERWRAARPSTRRATIGLGAALAAAAMAAVVMPPHVSPPETSGLAAVVPSRVVVAEAQRRGARLALAAGKVTVNAQPGVAGQWLTAGSVVSAEAGQACVLVPPGVTACLEAGTTLSVETLDAGRRRFRLHQGHVVAHLNRQPPGSSFGFETAAGSVVAKGTVFSLKSDGAAVTLRVHEGVVLNDQGTRATPYAAPSSAVLLQGGEPSASANDDERADSRLVELAKYFTDAAESTLVVTAALDSQISLGELQLGAAPLSALMLPGQYRMEVARAGFASIVEQLTVEPGAKVARNYEATLQLLDAPTRRTPTPRASASLAAELLQRARALRADGRYREAHTAYQRLLREHGASAEARVALVSLGDLQLSQLGDAGGALRSFEGYLRRGGALSQEASYGRIRALRRLGRLSEARTAASAFVSAYPNSVQAATLRKELP